MQADFFVLIVGLERKGVFLKMRIEKLEINKIKVTLFEEDLQMFNINISNIKPNSPEIYSFLCEIMKKVKTQTNFNPYEGQVIVEATPKNDRLVLTVYKNDNDLHKKKINPKNIKHIRAVKKSTDEKCVVFESDSFEDMCRLLKNCAGSINEKTALYKKGKIFYLVTFEQNPDLRMREFAHIVKCGKKYELFLKEHGSLVARGEKLLNIVKFLKSEK